MPEERQTVIRDLNGKVNYQLNSANRFQFLFTTDNKVRNARGASANTAIEATISSTARAAVRGSMSQLTHTLVLTDKLVFTNQMTFVDSGFSLDFQDLGPVRPDQAWATTIGDPTCLYNVQTLRSTEPLVTLRGA